MCHYDENYCADAQAGEPTCCGQCETQLHDLPPYSVTKYYVFGIPFFTKEYFV